MLGENDRLRRGSPRTQQTYSIRMLVIFEPDPCLVTHDYMCVTHENRKFLKPYHVLALLTNSLEGK